MLNLKLLTRINLLCSGDFFPVRRHYKSVPRWPELRGDAKLDFLLEACFVLAYYADAVHIYVDIVQYIHMNIVFLPVNSLRGS